jgi:hypothetical protein
LIINSVPAMARIPLKMDEWARSGDDADRAEHDRDLEERLGEVEIGVTFGGMIALGLEFLCLGEQFFFCRPRSTGRSRSGRPSPDSA